MSVSADAERARTRDEEFNACRDLAHEPRILDRFASTLRALGFAGPTWPVQIIVLAMITRHLSRPVSIVMQGESSSGKSYAIDQALRFFPAEAYYRLTAMSNKALIYSEEEFSHRMIVFCEGAGLSGDYSAYLVRSLLSEGRIEYEVTDFERRSTVKIDKEGPTGLITSTATKVDYELATRLLSVPTDDGRDLTSQIMLAEAAKAEGIGSRVDFEPFHALDRWIATGAREVAIPFATALAQRTDNRAVRMRRDFGAVLGLIGGHALLHQANREIDSVSRVVATLDDYRAVHGLISELVSRASGQAVPSGVRDTVAAVSELTAWKDGPRQGVSLRALSDRLELHRTTVTRRVNAALTSGYLIDVGHNGKRLLVPGEPMPEDASVLPNPAALAS